MKIKIKTAKLVEDQWGHHIEITKVGLYDEEGKWIKWLTLDQRLLDLLLKIETKVYYKENQ